MALPPSHPSLTLESHPFLIFNKTKGETEILPIILEPAC
jgi:hypothetical protein